MIKVVSSAPRQRVDNLQRRAPTAVQEKTSKCASEDALSSAIDLTNARCSRHLQLEIKSLSKATGIQTLQLKKLLGREAVRLDDERFLLEFRD